jgi:potassium/hydrogen antiporter
LITVAAMSEILGFGAVVLVVAAGFFLALGTYKLNERFPLPAPALFLLVAAATSDVFPGLAQHVSIATVERIAVVALIVILFDGGMHVGARRFRGSAVPISILGVLGTFATAGVMAVFAHALFDFSWTIAGVLGAALAPTDPAVLFSVLGNREVGGRVATILEGESGANDPVGIALMIAMLDLATHGNATFWTVVREFSVEMAVGLAVGCAGAYALLQLMRRVSLPNEGLYPLRTLAAAGVIYGVATVAHGSGFLAVFVAGLLIGDERAPYKAEIERFHTSLASIAEVVAFVALGLTVDLTDLGTEHLWLDGLALALLLTLVARPVVTWVLLVPTRLRVRERLFVVWGGLKGAVPILLAALALLDGVAQAHRIYGIVFVVVAFSVVAQGTTIPLAARLLGIPMRVVEPEPWDLSIRLRREPQGVQRFVVARGARAEGEALRDLPLGEHSWVSLIVRGDEPRQARGSYVFEAGDEVLLLSDSDDTAALRRLFEGGRA